MKELGFEGFGIRITIFTLVGIYLLIKILLLVISFESCNSPVRKAGQKLFSPFSRL